VGLHVSAAETTLALDAFRYRVHGHQLNLRCVGLTHFVENFAHRDEFFANLVNVLLIHLVSHD